VGPEVRRVDAQRLFEAAARTRAQRRVLPARKIHPAVVPCVRARRLQRRRPIEVPFRLLPLAQVHERSACADLWQVERPEEGRVVADHPAVGVDRLRPLVLEVLLLEGSRGEGAGPRPGGGGVRGGLRGLPAVDLCGVGERAVRLAERDELGRPPRADDRGRGGEGERVRLGGPARLEQAIDVLPRTARREVAASIGPRVEAKGQLGAEGEEADDAAVPAAVEGLAPQVLGVGAHADDGDSRDHGGEDVEGGDVVPRAVGGADLVAASREVVAAELLLVEDLEERGLNGGGRGADVVPDDEGVGHVVAQGEDVGRDVAGHLEAHGFAVGADPLLGDDRLAADERGLAVADVEDHGGSEARASIGEANGLDELLGDA